MNEQYIELLITLAAVILAIIKATDSYKKMKAGHHNKSIDAIEAAVESVYTTYVREIKEARADGRLTDQERKAAREMAQDRATELVRDQGLDIMSTIGADYINLRIERAIQKQKGLY